MSNSLVNRCIANLIPNSERTLQENFVGNLLGVKSNYYSFVTGNRLGVTLSIVNSTSKNNSNNNDKNNDELLVFGHIHLPSG